MTAIQAFAQDVAREDTVIFDTDQPIAASQSYNWLAGDINRQHGAHQLMWEPLFILNYEAGQIEPWLATDFGSNEDSTEWTINLRGGVEWSDGEVFDANDVLFTINAALNNASLNTPEVVQLREQVESIEAKSPTQLIFNLKEGNPRFVVENFAV
ncbi:MAG: ABC transporter substrate-binding protein, partial [Pseudomonadota bacterium]